MFGHYVHRRHIPWTCTSTQLMVERKPTTDSPIKGAASKTPLPWATPGNLDLGRSRPLLGGFLDPAQPKLNVVLKRHELNRRRLCQSDFTN